MSASGVREVYGVLAIPRFSHYKQFPNNVTLDYVTTDLFEQISADYEHFMGVELARGETYCTERVTQSDSSKPLKRVAAKKNSDLTVLYTLRDEQPLVDMWTDMLVGRAIFKLYELPEPFGEAGAAEAGGVESVENGAPSKPTQGDSTAALLKKVLYRLSNLEQDNQVVKKENQVILKDNRVLKERVDIIEQENRGLKEENRGLKEEIQAQKKRIDGLQKDLNASNTRCDLLEKQQRESETKYSKMEAAHCELANDHRNLKNDHNGLVADHRQLEMKMRSLHRRSLLDQARNELLFTTRLNRQDYENKPQALLAAVKQALPAGVDLSDLALQSIFLTGEIRAKGNIVAHEATQDEVAHAVLGSENTTAVRKVLREIYKYVYKTEPKLDLFV